MPDPKLWEEAVAKGMAFADTALHDDGKEIDRADEDAIRD